MKIHGQIGEGSNSHARWCSVCNQYHGVLYNCKHYPKDIKIKIKQENNAFINNLQDPKWIEEQLQNNIPMEVILLNKIFAGIEE